MLAFFADLSLIDFRVRYFLLFLLFLVIDNFECFLMGSLHKNIQLMLEFLSGPFLVLNDLPDDVICDIAIYPDDTTLF